MARQEDASILEAALIGFQAEKARIAAAIADLRRRLGTRGRVATAPAVVPVKSKTRTKHRISAEGRAKIAEAQRRRWAEAKKGK